MPTTIGAPSIAGKAHDEAGWLSWPVTNIKSNHSATPGAVSQSTSNEEQGISVFSIYFQVNRDC